MIAYIVILSLLATSCFFANPSGLQAHGIASPPTHQHIAKEALKVWQDCPPEIVAHAQKPIDSKLCDQCYAGYGLGKDIIIGSGEEDKEKNPLPPLINPLTGEFIGCSPSVIGYEFCSENEGRNGFMEHFWDPNSPNVGGYNCGSGQGKNLYNQGLVIDLTPEVQNPGNGHYDSAYSLAQDLWDNKVIRLYREGKWENDQAKIDEAYYWLGRVAHLLTDLCVPAHVYLLPHDYWYGHMFGIGQGDCFEQWFSDNPEKIFDYFGDDLKNRQQEEYWFEKLPNLDNFDWQGVHSCPSNLFRLFWYAAQKTKYFASKSQSGPLARDAVTNYVKLDGLPGIFTPSLWDNEQDYWGRAVVPITEADNIPGNEQIIADALIPHAMKAVAGLYRLFWFEANAIMFNSPRGYRGTPAIGLDGTIYITIYSSLIALNTDGTQKWKYDVGDVGYCYPVIGPDGTIYVTVYDESIIRAVRPDGNEKWSALLGGKLYSPPSLGRDETLYIGATDNTLYAINLANGSIKWKFITGGCIYSTPLIAHDGTIYVKASDYNYPPPPAADANTIYAIDQNGIFKWKYGLVFGWGEEQWGAIGRDGTLYATTRGGIVAINTAGHEKWRVEALGPGIGSPPSIGPDGTIYLGWGDGLKSGPHKFCAINSNGSVKWELTLPVISSSLDTYGIAACPAISTDGTIFITRTEYLIGYYLYAINPNGKLKWMFQLPYDNEFNWVQSPVIGGDGKLYVGLGELCCFNIGITFPDKSSWPMYGANPQHTFRANLKTANLPFLHLLLGD
jgi:outer membrane protein assembly factor BamB